MARYRGMFAVYTFIFESLLKVNTYLLQHHFKKVHTRNCSLMYKNVKMKGGLGWMTIATYNRACLARSLMETIFLVYTSNPHTIPAPSIMLEVISASHQILK